MRPARLDGLGSCWSRQCRLQHRDREGGGCSPNRMAGNPVVLGEEWGWGWQRKGLASILGKSSSLQAGTVVLRSLSCETPLKTSPLKAEVRMGQRRGVREEVSRSKEGDKDVDGTFGPQALQGL